MVEKLIRTRRLVNAIILVLLSFLIINYSWAKKETSHRHKHAQKKEDRKKKLERRESLVATAARAAAMQKAQFRKMLQDPERNEERMIAIIERFRRSEPLQDEADDLEMQLAIALTE